MKKILFFLFSVLMFCSCEKEDKIVINIQYVPCTFKTNSFNSNVDDSPLTRANNTRQISCYFPTAETDKYFTVEENTTFTVMLPAHETAKGYFVYTDEKTVNQYETVNANTENIFNTVWTGIPDKNKAESIVLKRSIGKFSAIKGNIPNGYSIVLNGKNINDFNWTTNTIGTLTGKLYYTTLSDTVSYVTFSNNEINNVEVEVKLLNTLNQEVLSNTFNYIVDKNKHKRVTFNSDININNGFVVSIDDTPLIEEDSEENLSK